MIDPVLLKTDAGLEVVRNSLKKRGEGEDAFDLLTGLVEKRRRLIVSSEDLQNKKNTFSKQIGQLQNTDRAKAEELKDEVRQIGQDLKNQKDQLSLVDEEYEKHMLAIPNILDADVPDGLDEQSNQIIFESAKPPGFSFAVKPHFEIAESLGLIDFEKGVKLSGSRFYVYNEQIAKLERKLTDFLLSAHEKKGYLERTVPFLVNDAAMYGTGQLPKFAGEYYKIESDALNLIPTAEVPLTNLYSDEILPSDKLPLYLTSATPCFRKEAGSAGKDTRGLIRVHQFHKVELVKFTAPEKSSEELEKLTSDAEDILKKFHLCYRKVLLCAGDTSFSSAKTYDLEVWLPGMQRWMEISSCSNFRDFQARRAKIRYKNSTTGKNEFVHTLNGSGVALGRLIAALLEYYQTADGQINWDQLYSMMN
ncbi:MAG: serine--tRNA ligase [Spirochaetia bacterium]|nr:serine--tRNA ligase [Spirochaetia bacterium]